MLRLFLVEKIRSALTGNKSKTVKAKTAPKNRRKQQRFDVDHKHITMMNEQDILVIKEVSLTGFSSKVSTRAYERFGIGDVYAAKFRYFGELYDLKAKVSWKEQGNVGFALQQPAIEVRAFLQRLIAPVALANTLMRVETSYTRDANLGKTWYHGDNDTDLYVWRAGNDEEITAWQLIHSDMFAEWEIRSGLKTGSLMINHESVSGILDVATQGLQQLVDTEINPDTKQFAVDLLSASQVEEREFIVEKLLSQK